jgi:hypothetical protein
MNAQTTLEKHTAPIGLGNGVAVGRHSGVAGNGDTGNVGVPAGQLHGTRRSEAV